MRHRGRHAEPVSPRRPAGILRSAEFAQIRGGATLHRCYGAAVVWCN